MTRLSLHQQGFTLLEVLIALTLMALLSIISWRALDLVERSSGRLNARVDDTLALVRVLGQIESDVSRYAGIDVLPQLTAAPALAMGTLRAPATGATLPPGIRWTAPVLTVMRSVHDGAWQQIAWRHDGNALRRAVGPPARTLPLPPVGPAEVVLDHVKSFRVRVWVPGQGWSALDASDTPQTATGLEIIVERQHHGVDETYRKVVLLP